MAVVTYDRAELVYPGAAEPAVRELDLEIADGEFMVLVGPSGCGKSTSLRMLAGLEEVTSGSIRIDGDEVTKLPPKDRDIAMVFQNYALYPHMTVAENMGFALRIAGVPKAERSRRVSEAAAILDLTDLLHRKPKALSGGQRQRVAMGRAIVRKPQVFCMDEPLSNLDAKLRVATRTQIAALQQRLGITTVYVTHDQVEAMTMGDRVAVMKDGELLQVDTPLGLYERPVNLFVAGFIGSPAMNLLDATTSGDGVATVDGVDFAIDRAAASASSGRVTLGIRPEDWRIADDVEPALSVRVAVVEELGADSFVYGTPQDAAPALEDGVIRQIIARVPGRRTIERGQMLRLTADPGDVHVFDTVTGERLA